MTFVERPDHLEHRRPRTPRERPSPAPSVLSPSGIAPPGERDHLLSGLEPGDVVIALDVADSAALARQWGPLVAADHRVHAARTAASTLRDHDRIVTTPDGDILVLLIDTFPEGGQAVFDRIRASWDADRTLGELVAGWASRDDEEPVITATKAVNALRRADPEHAPLVAA